MNPIFLNVTENLFAGENLYFLIIESGIVASILWLQWRSYVTTATQIEAFREIMPERSTYRLNRVPVTEKDLLVKDPVEILKNMHHYLLEQKEEEQNRMGEVFENPYIPVVKSKYTVPIIGIDVNHLLSPTTQRVLLSLNTYLIRNQGAVADFQLVRDIVERHFDADDQEIQASLPTPLYLGLMGTMFGIVVGLFAFVAKVFWASSGDNYSEGITFLLIGVIASMVASGLGLMMTTHNSVTRFRGAKQQVESRKNDFLSFLQTELLPILSQNVTAGMAGLQVNLTKFTQNFTTNLGGLREVVDVNYKGIHENRRLLEELNKADFIQHTNANLIMFREMKETIGAMHEFGTYIKSLNAFISQTKELGGQIQNILERTSHFETIAQKVESTVMGNDQLMRFLGGHLHEIERSGQTFNESVNRMNKLFDKGLSTIEEETVKRLQTFREFTNQEQLRLEESMKESKTALAKLYKLDDLLHLLQKSSEIQNRQSTQIEASFTKLNQSIEMLAAASIQPLSTLNRRWQKAQTLLEWSNRIGLFLLLIIILSFIGFLAVTGNLL